jgi:hypothetical protein
MAEIATPTQNSRETGETFRAAAQFFFRRRMLGEPAIFAGVRDWCAAVKPIVTRHDPPIA